jgi:hypothetical protein
MPPNKTTEGTAVGGRARADSVGWQSGSHYSTIQALEPYLPADKINLSFKHGLLFRRLELLVDRQAPAAALFSGPYYFAEQLGFRKVIDTTFLIATMIHGDPNPEDLRKFFRALRRAQRDLDLRPDRYTHYYRNEFPERFHAIMDTRRWGPPATAPNLHSGRGPNSPLRGRALPEGAQTSRDLLERRLS